MSTRWGHTLCSEAIVSREIILAAGAHVRNEDAPLGTREEHFKNLLNTTVHLWRNWLFHVDIFSVKSQSVEGWRWLRKLLCKTCVHKMNRLYWSLTMQWLTLSWTLALLSAGANGFLPINPGIGVQIKTRQKPSDTMLQLHPSLSSPTYLAAASNSKSQPSPGNLRRVRTNFQVDVDAAPIVRIASSSDHDGLAPLEDNLFSASNTVPAPYSSLPDSYRNIHPVSYYATHTYVPPIKNLYKDDTNNKEASLKETPRGAEGTREIPSPVRNNALNDATTSDESRSSTIVSHEVI